MGVLEQAKALAAELGRSQELQVLKQVEQQVMADQAAVNMIQKYMEMESALMMKQMEGKGQIPEAEVKALNSYREQISKSPLVARFFAAKQNFDQMWYQVNQIISSVI